MRISVFNSLRSRYALIAAIVTVAAFLIAILSNIYLQDSRKKTTENISVRNQLLEHSRLIRDAVWNTRQSLATFLLEPHNNQTQQQIDHFLRNAKNETSRLLEHPWISDNRQEDNLKNLQNTLMNLEDSVNELIKARLDATQQYPALAIARETMLPNYSQFNIAASLAINEHYEVDDSEQNNYALTTLLQARHIWTQMISNFRMYLANRLGSFDENALPVQEKDILTQYEGLQQEINILKKLDDDGALDLQASASVEELVTASTSWYEMFLEVKRIHASDKWRTDAILIQTKIEPHMNSIWRALITLDKDIELSTIEDLSVLSRLAQTLARELWVFAALCLSLIIIGYLALEKGVLAPIATIAGALKKESEGIHEAELPERGVRETQDLVSAFITMRKQVQARQTDLEYHALHDSLTNLGNRNRLIEHMELAIKQAVRNQGAFSLLMLDLNQFKEVNDTLGHPVGDQLLIEVGMRLAGLLRESDTIARLGGDEFALLLPTANDSHAIQVAEKIAEALDKPFLLEGQQLFTNASIGIATYPQHGLNPSSLIQHADIAMYLAKKGTTGWAVYDSEQDRHSVGRLGLMGELRNAVAKNELSLHFQPKSNLMNDEIYGVEALLRWNHPEHGFIQPEELVALAEQTGFIYELSAWVIENAISQGKEWNKKGIVLNIAVNLSAQNLQDERIVTHVRELLVKTGFPPKQLTLEITENAMMAEPERAVVFLGHLSAMGIQLAVDDFGTGFSSLGYLKKLPVNELKIDKSFVIDMSTNDNDAVIVRSTIDLAHNLGLKVVAEGVEDSSTLELLKILRCDTAQGYRISKPLPAKECFKWLREQMSHLKLVNGSDSRTAS